MSRPVFLFLMLILIGVGIFVGITRYQECREFGFSQLYCLSAK